MLKDPRAPAACQDNDTPCSDQGGECNTACADHKKDVIPPSPELRAKVMAYEHPELVHRIAAENGTNHALAYGWFKDGLDYLYRAATSPRAISPSQDADRAWHAFLLYSRDYREFCQEMFGFFIDHCPKPAPKAEWEAK